MSALMYQVEEPSEADISTDPHFTARLVAATSYRFDLTVGLDSDLRWTAF
jgi:hypothetical protein